MTLTFFALLALMVLNIAFMGLALWISERNQSCRQCSLRRNNGRRKIHERVRGVTQ